MTLAAQNTCPWDSLGAAAICVLTTANASEKADMAQQVGAAWAQGGLPFLFGEICTPDRPARPQKPELLLPRDMPRRRAGGPKGRIALLHALAHIELNAIDLAFDIVARFGPTMPQAFSHDWIFVGAEEGKHFNLLNAHLNNLGGKYGDLPAHDGLWDAAFATRDNLLARLAIIPMVLEARGLDVTPAMTKKLQSSGDLEGANILKTIYEDEKGHVAAGTRWFAWETARLGVDPETSFHTLVRTYFRGELKRPFNDAARAAAGLSSGFYEPLAERQKPHSE